MEQTPKSPRVALPCRPPKTFALLLLCLCASLGFPGAAAAQDRLRVAVVDVAKVFGGYYKTKEVEKTLSEAREVARQQIDAHMEDHHRLVEEVARLHKELDDPAPGEAAKADRRKKYDDKIQETHAQEQETRELRATLDRNVQELTLRLRNHITEDILNIVRARVETSHYDLVLNKSGRGVDNKIYVLYANPSLEITDDVIATLNQNHPDVPDATPAASPKP